MSAEIVRLILAGASSGCVNALDIGAGEGRTRPPVAYWQTIDAYQTPPFSDHHEKGDIREILQWRDTKSVDLVYALDVIEHLDKTSGLLLLGQMERIAKKRVLVFTPNGFMEQKSEIPWQVHRSGWDPSDFRSRGYATAVMDFDYGKGKGIERDRALWAVKEMGTT